MGHSLTVRPIVQNKQYVEIKSADEFRLVQVDPYHGLLTLAAAIYRITQTLCWRGPTHRLVASKIPLTSSQTMLRVKCCCEYDPVTSAKSTPLHRQPLQSFYHNITADSICSDTIRNVHIIKEPRLKGTSPGGTGRKTTRKGGSDK